MNTIKIKLSTSGRIAALDKNFPLYCGQFNNVLLNILVPTAILSGGFEVGQVENTLDPTDAADEIALNTLLTAYIKTFTGDETRPHAGDVVFYIYNNAGVLTYYKATFDGAVWGFEAVDYFDFGSAGANVKIGMVGTFPNGVVFKSKSYYTRFVKKFTNEGVEYALYEKQMPKDFTDVVGDQTLVINVENIAGENITNIVTSQTATLPILRSTVLDRDEAVEASELARLEADMNALTEDMQGKQDKQDNDIQFTTEKTVVGALNNLNTRENSTAATASAADARSVENAGKIATLESVVGAGEYYVGTMTVTTDILPLPNPTTVLNNYVQTKEGRAPKGGDTVIIIQKITDQLDKNYKAIFNGTNWIWYEIPPMELAGNGSAGIVEGTYTVGATANTIVDITGGKIVAIYVKDNNGNYADIRTYLNTLHTSIADIIAGNTQVGVALRALQDGLGNNIVNTYLTQTAGATKQYVKDYAMPKEFNNAFVIKKVNNEVVFSEDWSFGFGNSVSLDAVDAPIGETVLGRATYTLGNINFEISSKNSFSGKYQFLRSATSNEQIYLKVKTYIDTSNGILPLLQSTDIVPVSFGNINIASATVTGKFKGNIMGNPYRLKEGDTIYQEFILIREASNSITYSLTSDSMFPSNFWLNTGVQVLEYGDLGEMKVITATPSVEMLTFGNNMFHNTKETVVLTISDNILIQSLERGKTVQFSMRFDTTGLTIPQDAFTVIRYTVDNETKYLSVLARANSEVLLGGGVKFSSFQYCRYKNSYGWNRAQYQALITIDSGVNTNGIPIELGEGNYSPYPYVDLRAVVESPNIVNNSSGTWALGANNWSGGEMDFSTAPIMGIGDHDAAFFTPATIQDREKAVRAGLFIVPNKVTKNGQNYWRFTCVNTPTEDISLNFYVVKGMGGAEATLFLCGVYAVPSTPTPPVVENQVTDEFGNPVTDEFGNPVTAE